MNNIPDYYRISAVVQSELQLGYPLVALESTVITHGLPLPDNLELARRMEETVRLHGANPATIGVLSGNIVVGMTDYELKTLASDKNARKIGRRDFAGAVLKRQNGGTTVSATMLAAHRVGIQVFATGGIGGVHRNAPFDISADLQALADTPMIVVCAGAKAILDLPATLEYLETMSVPVIGYHTDEFPAFYSRSSGLPVSQRLDTPADIARFARLHWENGLRSAVLVTNPIPVIDEIPREEIEPLIENAVREAQQRGIRGQAVTPFLLDKLKDLSAQRSVKANLSLLLNNAQLAARIAVEMASEQARLA